MRAMLLRDTGADDGSGSGSDVDDGRSLSGVSNAAGVGASGSLSHFDSRGLHTSEARVRQMIGVGDDFLLRRIDVAEEVAPRPTAIRKLLDRTRSLVAAGSGGGGDGTAVSDAAVNEQMRQLVDEFEQTVAVAPPQAVLRVVRCARCMHCARFVFLPATVPASARALPVCVRCRCVCAVASRRRFCRLRVCMSTESEAAAALRTPAAADRAAPPCCRRGQEPDAGQGRRHAAGRTGVRYDDSDG
jgi:hypothetical protein